MEVSILVATFGDDSWTHLARKRALPSAAQFGCPVIYEHRDTLQNARNAALAQAETEFCIHLDADDALEPGYVEAMSRGTADLRVPRLRQVRRGRPREPFMPQVWSHAHECTAECLRHGNWIVIGACVRTQLARDVGGWWDEGWSEDWSLWARCWQAGGTVEPIPDAIYRAWVRPRSRNHALSNTETVDWHRRIEASIWPDAA